MMVVGSYLLHQMTVHTTWGAVVINMIVLGLGIGSLMPLMSMVVQNAFPYAMMGTVNSTQQFVSSLGGVIAAPIFGAILAKAFSAKLSTTLPVSLGAFNSKLSSLNPQTLLTAQAQQAIATQFKPLDKAGHALYLQLMLAVKTSLTFGIQQIFQWGLIFAILSFIVTFFLPEVQLKGKEYFEAAKANQGDQ